MIKEFKEGYAFLSNFYPSPFTVLGKEYTTNEHYFQACKMVNEEYHEYVRKATSAARAKKLARACPKRQDWERIKEDVMLFGLRRKFAPGSHLARRLLDTGRNHLVEGNTWGDVYWGVCKGVGQNRLGVLLMQVREELK